MAKRHQPIWPKCGVRRCSEHAGMPITALCAHCQGHDGPLYTWPKPWTLACTNNLLWAWCMHRPACTWPRSWQPAGIIPFLFYIYIYIYLNFSINWNYVWHWLKKLIFLLSSLFFLLFMSFIVFFSIILESHYTIFNYLLTLFIVLSILPFSFTFIFMFVFIFYYPLGFEIERIWIWFLAEARNSLYSLAGWMQLFFVHLFFFFLFFFRHEIFYVHLITQRKREKTDSRPIPNDKIK